MERNYKLTIEYVGTNYYGWQFLPGKPTIQGELLKAIEKLFGQRVKLTGAGRTDAGVHALGQVANFKVAKDFPPDRLVRALNALLPPDIRVKEACLVASEFDARRSALGKRYLYRIHNASVPTPFEHRRSWFFPKELSLKKMVEASKYLIGAYDFTSFSKRDRKRSVNPFREVNDIEIRRTGDFLELRFWGVSFLRHMVRVMTATLVKVGEGDIEPEEVEKILKERDRRKAPFLAPPDGLYLEKVYYENYPFSSKKEVI